MFWLGWLSTIALAAPCAGLADLTEAGWAAFYDAELERSREIVGEANQALKCQTAVVPKEQLLELYRLDAMVSVSQEDRKSAMYATIRMVTLDPKATPDDDLGPVIAELHSTWVSRLSEATISVTEEGDGEAWVDGSEVSGAGLTVVEGEHLVQVRDADGTFVSELRELSGDLALSTGGAAVVAVVEPPDTVVVTPPVGPVEVPPDEPDPVAKVRNHRVGLLATGGLITAAGAGVAGYAWTQERAFLANDYRPDTIGECQRAEPCYAGARRSVIVDDAKQIRLMYGVGYGVAAAGVLLLGTELVILPSPTAGGGGVVLHTRW